MIFKKMNSSHITTEALSAGPQDISMPFSIQHSVKHTHAHTYKLMSIPKVAQTRCTDPSYHYYSLPVQSPFGLFSSTWTCQVWVDSCRPDLLKLVSCQLWFVLISKALILMGLSNQAKWNRWENWLKCYLKSGPVKTLWLLERERRKKKILLRQIEIDTLSERSLKWFGSRDKS